MVAGLKKAVIAFNEAFVGDEKKAAPAKKKTEEKKKKAAENEDH